MRVTLNFMEVPGLMFGMKRYTLELAAALAPLGVEVRLRPSRGRELRVGPLRVGGRVTQALRNFVPVRGPGLVHATDHKSNPRPGADVVTVHDLIPHEDPALVGGGRLVRWREAHAVRRALASGHVLTDTEHVRGQLLKDFGASPGQVHAVPLGVRHDLFYPETAEPASPVRPGRLNVLLAMPCDLRKRGDLVLAAAARLPFVHVVHVGGQAPRDWARAPMEAIAPALAQLEREGRLTRLEGVDDPGLRRLMGACDLFCHPSAAEGFSLPPLEALACGARVLASDIPAHREVLAGAARFVPLGVDAWEAALRECWDGQAVRDGRFQERRQRLRHARRFTWEATARATLDLYERAAAG
jgi:glycosyltransferase involved in cell wall biosynthesis